MSQIFARKPLKVLLEEMAGENRLRRILGPVQLTSLGVGCIIGAGIFVMTGKAAHDTTGPALMLSFVAAGIACVFAAFCYAEFASMVPVAGSAYTYAYATLGELLAWIIGWDLVLEYGVASASVAHGWSHYFQEFIKIFGWHWPDALKLAPFQYNAVSGAFESSRSIVDLPAIVIALVVTLILVKGIRESASFNAAMVIVKVVTVLFVIAVGAYYVDPANWHPFAPHGYSGLSFFGKPMWGEVIAGKPVGMLAGAAVIFFAYIGFDSVSTHSEEARNPKRDVPIGIIVSLVLCTVLYIAVAAVLTGMVPYNQIDKDAPVAVAFGQVGLPWAKYLISIGALTGITSVLLVLMLSQPRVLLAMARDGLLPHSFFGAVHPRYRTPWKSTILTGLFVATLGGLLPLDVLAELVNIGTLLAFVIVCAAVLIMRKTHPHAERPFRAPFVPLVPILGILTCLLLMFSLPWENWLRLGLWLLAGFVVYFGYSRHHSKIAAHLEREIAVHGVSGGVLADDIADEPPAAAPGPADDKPV
jgi:basic amino acid/polyamine antiporter, APA family